MKFSALNDFKGGVGARIESVLRYLSIDLASSLRELRVGLSRLSFEDNFEGFEVEVSIAAGEEQPIGNRLKNGAIPTRWITVKKDAASYAVCNGDTPWNSEFVWLKNTHSTDASTLTVVFLK